VSSIFDVTWPVARASEALAALVHEAKLASTRHDPPATPEDVDASPERFGRFVELAASWMGVEAEPVSTTYADASAFLRSAGPALFCLPDHGGGRCLIALVARRRGALLAVAPDLSVHRVNPGELRDALVAALEARLAAEVDPVVDAAGLPPRRRERVRRAILATRLDDQLLEQAWLLRLAQHAPFGAHFRRDGGWRRVAAVLLVQAATYGIGIASYFIIGRAALDGRLDRGWFWAWALIVIALQPIVVLEFYWQAHLAIQVGALLKQRLVAGALNLSSEAMRNQGAGQLLGRVLESGAIDSISAGDLSRIEVPAAFVVLALGASAPLEVGLLAFWILVSGLLCWRYFRRRRAWTDERIAMTGDLVERMQGHRTRLAQRAREHWHEDEDVGLTRYLAESKALDRAAARLNALVPNGWLLLGIIGLAPGFVSGSASQGALAVTLLGIDIARRGLSRAIRAAPSVAGAAIAWRQVAPVFRSAGAVEPPVAPDIPLGPAAKSVPVQTQPVLEAREVVFGYRAAGRPVLRGCSLAIGPGDRVLLEGASGGGKSTFASLLCGLRQPQAGLVLAGGLDRKTLGTAGWRRRVVAAPQFHENHVLSATFAFNLLMGRRWPPQPGDYRDAQEICRELALDGLIARMPSGLEQMVGETGWQLSHGERSRLYIARALLQDADVLVFDESFAALDPDTLERAFSCVLARAKSLVVIAHP
jgi:ATP-binding cassette subfamily B protein